MHVTQVLAISIPRSPEATVPVLDLGYLLLEVGSPGERPEIAISQLLEDLQHSITTQFGVELVVSCQ